MYQKQDSLVSVYLIYFFYLVLFIYFDLFSKKRQHSLCNLLFGLIGHFGILKDINISFFLSSFYDQSPYHTIEMHSLVPLNPQEGPTEPSILDHPMMDIFRGKQLEFWSSGAKPDLFGCS